MMAAADIVGWTETQNNKAKAATQISTTSLFFRVICQIPPFENAIYFIIAQNPAEESKSTPTHNDSSYHRSPLCFVTLVFLGPRTQEKIQVHKQVHKGIRIISLRWSVDVWWYNQIHWKNTWSFINTWGIKT